MTVQKKYGAGRLTPLEAYRGIAALIVLVHHFFLGFAPQITGVLPSSRVADSLVGSYYFFLFNGGAAVHFFFALSGFVLCWSYFGDENSERLYEAMLKRYPRLAGIVVATTVASFVLFWFEMYYFRQASEISKSDWLLKFGYGIDPSSFEPKFMSALLQGLTTFFTGESSYNSNLWTMKHEFFGSLLVYMIALFVVVALRHRSLVYFFLLLSVSTYFYTDFMFPFVIGLFLSIYVSRRNPQLGAASAMGLIILGLYLLGYAIPEGSYAWAGRLPHSWFPKLPLLLHTTGACLIIFATMANLRIFESLDGAFFRFLGKISFPIYLVHLLVIASISAYAFVFLSQRVFDQKFVVAITFCITLLVSVAASIPLSRLDDWWVKTLNSHLKRN